MGLQVKENNPGSPRWDDLWGMVFSVEPLKIVVSKGVKVEIHVMPRTQTTLTEGKD